MYNINNHYKIVYQLAKSTENNNRDLKTKLLYFFPFGSSDETTVEIIQENKPHDNLDVVLLCYDQEPIDFSFNFYKFNFLKNKHLIMGIKFYEEPVFIKEFNTAISLNLTKNVRTNYIFLNTEKDSPDKDKILKRLNFIDCYYFFHALAAVDWYREYRFYPNFNLPSERVLKKKYITFNRITGNARTYRTFFVSELLQRNLIEFGHISYSKNCPCHGEYKKNILEAQKKYNINQEYVNKTLENLSLLADTLRIDTPPHEIIENDSQTIGPISQLTESFLYVVTETCFWDTKKHLTEKIFKPIVCKMPFVLIGCAENLQYLKSYGFKTFDHWWDESYDNIQDPLTRLQECVNIIEKICQLPFDELQKMLGEMQEILDYNYNWFYSKEFVDLVYNELETNLKLAYAQL
jgi:hypothetical protein